MQIRDHPLLRLAPVQMHELPSTADLVASTANLVALFADLVALRRAILN
ncbi:MAG TPA: hypothetical protein VNR70_01585 [Steroidobacteraceae bacterium]|nr:hypothetical protein [Steroidobacteraceae bacterium]